VTRDFSTMIVPNAQLLGSTITILGKRDGQATPARMWVYFNVDFRYDPAEVIRVVEEALAGAPIVGVSRDPLPNVVCMDFARDNKDSMGVYAFRYWLTDLARDDPTNSLVRSRIFAALRRANIPLALPAAQIREPFRIVVEPRRVVDIDRRHLRRRGDGEGPDRRARPDERPRGAQGAQRPAHGGLAG